MQLAQKLLQGCGFGCERLGGGVSGGVLVCGAVRHDGAEATRSQAKGNVSLLVASGPALTHS